MLHDPSKVHPSLPGFIAWLKTKPPQEEYNWLHTGHCACAQYSQECMGYDDAQWVQERHLNGLEIFRFDTLSRKRRERFHMWATLDALAMPRAGKGTQVTFGALLKRAKKKQALLEAAR